MRLGLFNSLTAVLIVRPSCRWTSRSLRFIVFARSNSQQYPSPDVKIRRIKSRQEPYNTWRISSMHEGNDAPDKEIKENVVNKSDEDKESTTNVPGRSPHPENLSEDAHEVDPSEVDGIPVRELALRAEYDLHYRQDATESRVKTAKPYSIPEPEKYASLSPAEIRDRIRGQKLAELSEATWYADKATRPVLLTFDAFGTLFAPKESVYKQYQEVSRQFGLEFEEDAIKQSFKSAFSSLSRLYPNYGKASRWSPEQWWTRLIRDTLQPLLQPGEKLPPDLPASLYERFSTSEGYALFPDVSEFLELVGSSYQANLWPPRRTMLGVNSNSDPRVRGILHSFGIDIAPAMFPPRFAPRGTESRDFGPAYFAFATLSYETGFEKPDRMAFDAASRDAQWALDSMHSVARLTRSGGDVLDDVHADFHHMHIGDDFYKDVMPALNCGWDAVLVDREADAEVSTRTTAEKEYTVINNLNALAKLVTKKRLEASGLQKPVWLDDEAIARRKVRNPKDLVGRRVAPHPLSTEDHKLYKIE